MIIKCKSVSLQMHSLETGGVFFLQKYSKKVHRAPTNVLFLHIMQQTEKEALISTCNCPLFSCKSKETNNNIYLLVRH